MAIDYEWAVEFLDDEGDILDADHRGTFLTVAKIAKESGGRTDLVLVRNAWRDGYLKDRSWAYIEDGKLPEEFQDENGASLGYKVPQRFHAEVAKATQENQ